MSQTRKKDTDYVTVSTRIHAMENRLLNRERIERMVPANAMQELFYPQYQTDQGARRMGQHDQAAFSRLSYLRYGRSSDRATVPAAHG